MSSRSTTIMKLMHRQHQPQQQCRNNMIAASLATLASSAVTRDNSSFSSPSLASSISSSASGGRPLRRRRQLEGKIPVQGNNNPPNKFEQFQLDGGAVAAAATASPFDHGEATMDDYLKKTSLSPWVPVPEVVARKVFDLANATSNDVHVDLGSGDGRINFLAIDYAKVQQSLGVDIDPSIVQVAMERLSKRHPKPANLNFTVGNLLDATSSVWEEILQIEPTIITMYFAHSKALETFRHILEEKLVGRSCKILTIGYEMPGWESSTQEVILGTQIHLYHWGGSTNNNNSSDSVLGSSSQQEIEHDDDLFAFQGDDLIKEKPQALNRHQKMLEGEKFQGSPIFDRTGQYAIRGFNPDIFDEEEDDDADWWEDEEAENDVESTKPKDSRP